MKAEDFNFFNRFVNTFVRQAGVGVKRDSPHAKGRGKSPFWREKRKKRRLMARASRRRNRR